MNPAVVLQVSGVHCALGFNVPPVTAISKDPWSLPVTPAPTVFPLLGPVSHAPGLEPAKVTNVPFLKSSMTVLGSVRLIVKNRLNVSFAQSGPHVPESVEVLAIGPKCSVPLVAKAACRPGGLYHRTH